jgi:thymidylate kinase
MCVAIMGADGSGKTTVTNGLVSVGGRRVVALKMGLQSGALRWGGPVVRWVRRAGRVLELSVKSRLALRRGDVVVWDRHPMEDAVTGVAGRRVLTRGHGWMQRLLPAPEFVVVLDVEAAVLAQRRPGETRSTLETLRARFLALAEAAGAVVVDAGAPPDQVLARVESAISNAVELSGR